MTSKRTGSSKLLGLAATGILAASALAVPQQSDAAVRHVTDTTNHHKMSNYANCYTDGAGVRRGYGTSITQWDPNWTGYRFNREYQSVVHNYTLQSGTWYHRGSNYSGWQWNYSSVTSNIAFQLVSGGSYGNLSYHYLYSNGTWLYLTQMFVNCY